MNTDEPTPPPASSPVVGPRRRAAVVFIFITVVLDVLALGIIVPVLPGLVRDFMGGNAAQGAEVYGLFGTVWAAMQFVFAPVLGSLSDRFGRRPVILLSNFGLGLDYVFMALAPSLAWLFVGRVISGITAASFPTAGAYIADVTPPDKRAASFGLLGAAFGIGFVLGPALGGVLGKYDPRLPFWVAAGMSLANACYGLFVLPESLPAERRTAFSWRRANPVAALGLFRSQPGLLVLAVVVFLNSLAHDVFPSVWVIYAGYRFGWDTSLVGGTLAAAGVCSALVQAVLIRQCVTRFGERRTLLLGTAFGVLGFTLYGLASRPWIFLLAIPIGSLWGLGGPAVQGMMSRRVSPSAQGQLQGAISSMRGITGMLGPTLFTQTFALAIAGGWVWQHGWQVPGAPFLLAAGLLALALTVAWLATDRDTAATKVLETPPVAAPSFTSEVS